MRVPNRRHSSCSSATIDSIQWRMEIVEDIPQGAVQSEKGKKLQDELRDALEAIDQTLAKSYCLVGTHFSTAEICVSYQLYWLRFSPELKSVMDTFPRVGAYIDRMFGRPAAETAKWPRPPNGFGQWCQIGRVTVSILMQIIISQA